MIDTKDMRRMCEDTNYYTATILTILDELDVARSSLRHECGGCIRAPNTDDDNYSEECMNCCRFYGDGYSTSLEDGDEE